MVSVRPGGEIVGFCPVWFHDVTRSAYFEPIGIMPAHQRRGLDKTLMIEGLSQLKRLGATKAFVGSDQSAAHALYASAGFIDYNRSQVWYKSD